jgi:MarR family transcriptional regulator, organic hydroperoxide resistance regulator
VTDQSTEDRQQTWEVADCFFELMGNIVGEAEQLAQRFGVPAPFIKALHILECPLAMKDLGKRMHCDPSFVTLVADMLEKRGLARREPHPADRRIKNVVLTEDGVAMKQRLEAEITARMPWNRALSAEERSQLLALIRKMLSTNAQGAAATGAAATDALHGPLASLLVSALKDGAVHDSAGHEQEPSAEPGNHPTAAGEVTSAVSGASAAG